MTEPNTQLFIDVLAQIEREPEKWDQGKWRSACGTSHCFAGWAIQITEPLTVWSKAWCIGGMSYKIRTEKGGWRQADRQACDYLGLPIDDQELFSPGNTLDDLYRISADLLGLDETVLREKVAAEVGSAVAS